VDGRRIETAIVVGDGATLRIGLTTFSLSAAEPTQERAERLLAAQTRVALAAAPGPFAGSPPPSRSGRRVDSRQWLPAATTFVVIIATAVTLVIYFAAH
jgi:hypothetical protein